MDLSYGQSAQKSISLCGIVKEGGADVYIIVYVAKCHRISKNVSGINGMGLFIGLFVKIQGVVYPTMTYPIFVIGLFVKILYYVYPVLCFYWTICQNLRRCVPPLLEAFPIVG
jgi:hypothetical protein